jgi:hypothetical protein
MSAPHYCCTSITAIRAEKGKRFESLQPKPKGKHLPRRYEPGKSKRKSKRFQSLLQCYSSAAAFHSPALLCLDVPFFFPQINHFKSLSLIKCRWTTQAGRRRRGGPGRAGVTAASSAGGAAASAAATAATPSPTNPPTRPAAAPPPRALRPPWSEFQSQVSLLRSCSLHVTCSRMPSW